MQNAKTNLFAAIAALFMTAVLTAPIATGEGSGLTVLVATGVPVALA